jgi:excisionase family DNA binding protein
VHFCQVGFLKTRHAKQTRARLRARMVRSRHAQNVGETVKIYTADEVAGLLKVDYKTVLRLIQRGLLKAIPGIRHKRITEQELNRFLGIKQTQGGAA